MQMTDEVDCSSHLPTGIEVHGAEYRMPNPSPCRVFHSPPPFLLPKAKEVNGRIFISCCSDATWNTAEWGLTEGGAEPDDDDLQHLPRSFDPTGWTTIQSDHTLRSWWSLSLSFSLYLSQIQSFLVHSHPNNSDIHWVWPLDSYSKITSLHQWTDAT